jgi:hypothetical protein
MTTLLLLVVLLIAPHTTTPQSTEGILLSNRQFALELHKRCNPDDPNSESPKFHLKDQSESTYHAIAPPTWIEQWQIDSFDFPCLNNTAPGIECDSFYDNTPGKEGNWLQITSIQLPSIGLRCYPEVVISQYTLKHLHTLDLSGTDNEIDIDTFRHFFLPAIPNVQHLNVGHAITHARSSTTDDRLVVSGETSLCSLSKLTFLDLTNAGIDGPLLGDACIGNLHTLETAILKGNNLTECSQEMSTLLMLQRLDLSSNQLLQFTSNENTTLSNCLRIPSLKRLDLTHSLQNYNGGMASTLCVSNRLEWLDLSNNAYLSSLPDCCSVMSRLTYLDLSSTSILPAAWLKGMSSLETLHWGNNYNSLHFHRTWIRSIFPENGMPSLHVLNLSHSSKNDGGNTIDQFVLSDRTSVVIKNRTMNLSISVLSGLRVLDLSSCSMSGMLSIATTLKHLRALHLSNNRLSGDLSKVFSFGQHIEILNVQKNQLSGELTIGLFQTFSDSIRILRLSDNSFSSKNIPFQYLLSFKRLEVLDLSRNINLKGSISTTMLPTSLNLMEVDVRGGILQNLNTETLSTTYQQILQIDRAHFEVDALSDVSASTLVSCFSLRFLNTNAILRIDPSDSSFAHCICLGGGGSAPNCLNCPRNAMCGLLGNDLTCYAGYWYSPETNTCVSCSKNISITTMLKSSTEVVSDSGMSCPTDGTTGESIQIQHGYWRIDGRPRENFMSYQKCLVPGACNGGNNSNCSEGYDGLLCATCFAGGSDSNEDRIYLQSGDGFLRYYLGTDGRCKSNIH